MPVVKWPIPIIGKLADNRYTSSYYVCLPLSSYLYLRRVTAEQLENQQIKKMANENQKLKNTTKQFISLYIYQNCSSDNFCHGTKRTGTELLGVQSVGYFLSSMQPTCCYRVYFTWCLFKNVSRLFLR